MATRTSYDKLTFLELANRRDPKGNMMTIAEVLNQTNPIIQDAPFVEANGDMFHKCTRRASIPTGSWRRFYQGVGLSATRTITVNEGIGMLETYSEPDKALINMEPDPVAARTQEAMGVIEGMFQELTATVLYGNISNSPEEINGLATRMPSLAATTNVIGAGGSGADLTSIFIVQWGLNEVFMIYPKGHPFMGVNHTDLGEVTVSTSTTSVASAAQYQAYRDHFQAMMGMAVKDDRCIARLCNIESGTETTNIFDEDDLIKLLNRMKNSGAGATIYAHEEVITQMEIALKDKNNVNYTAGGGEGLAGEPVVRFRGHPVKKLDQILTTESALT